jgi:hypothetical protein
MSIDTPSIIIICSIGAGVIGLFIRYSFKSKCDRVEICFGCLKIHREVEQEDNNINDVENNNNNNRNDIL